MPTWPESNENNRKLAQILGRGNKYVYWLNYHQFRAIKMSVVVCRSRSRSRRSLARAKPRTCKTSHSKPKTSSMIAGAITSQTTTGRQPQRRLININANGVRYRGREIEGERKKGEEATMTITYRILVCRVPCSMRRWGYQRDGAPGANKMKISMRPHKWNEQFHK